MKNKIKILFFLFSFISKSSFSQAPTTYICSYHGTGNVSSGTSGGVKSNSLTPYGGVFTPKGDMRALIIYVTLRKQMGTLNDPGTGSVAG